MVGAILKATNGSFQKCMLCCCSICVKKVIKLLAFIVNPLFVFSGLYVYSYFK